MAVDNYHEEENLGKAYDARLMRRLLRYALPYWRQFALAILLLSIITGADLSRPYIIKIAIDEHINTVSLPMVVLSSDELAQTDVKTSVQYQGRVFVRRDWFPQGQVPPQWSSQPRAQILADGGSYYLIDAVLPPDTDFEVEKHGAETLVKTSSAQYGAERLGSGALRQFRTWDVTGLKGLAFIFLIVITLGFGVNYAQIYLLNYLGQNIILNIRMELFRHLQTLPMAFFDNNPVGRLITRLTNDTETLNEMYTNVLVNLFKDLAMLLGIVVLMFSLNARLALTALSVLPFIALATVLFRLKARKAYRNVRTRLARVNATLAENIMGMRIVQVFHRESRKHQEFDDINDAYLQATLREVQVFAFFRPLMEVLGSLALSLLIWFGGADVIRGTLEFGVLYAFVNYIDQFFKPISDLTEKYNILQSAMASSERIFLLLDTDDRIENAPKPLPLKRLDGAIEFKHVWFAYTAEDWVLRDVSFRIEPGQTVAFVGATGAGKSSILNLMNRYYDIQKGQILIDGVDIREYDKHDLRRRIGMVLQDVFLFTGDIKSNVRLNKLDVSEEDIRRVAAYVNANRFIERLPGKYDERVTERGSTLSAGQRQLLAFARALAFDPDVLILDEATANIDTETEQLIQDALKKLIAGHTTIVVAHRLSTIQHADKIILLHKGKVREMGTHQELLARGGLYYDLYRLQYKEDFARSGEQVS